MGYVVDRQRILWTQDVVAVLRVHTRKIRSRVIQRDNSLYGTLTRPRTLWRLMAQPLGRFTRQSWRKRND